MRTSPTRISNCIDRLLRQHDGSIRDWCKKHGFHPQHLTKIKHGHVEPSAWSMLQIAQAFGRPVEEIFSLVPTDDIWEPELTKSTSAKNDSAPKKQRRVVVGGPSEIDRVQFLKAVDLRGFASISTPRLAKAAGISNRSAWNWLRGQRVSESTHQACLKAVGLSEA